MPGDVSPHFSRHEFDLPDAKAQKRGLDAGAMYPAEWIDSRLKPLCAALEVIRAEFGGKPVRVISGYRPLPYNRALGSKDDSQHVQGRAADFQIAGVCPGAIYRRVLELHQLGRIEIGGIGVYDDFNHIDVRGGAMATWDERKK
jgi:uncharacterized protein YcbK (DUF882 family)